MRHRGQSSVSRHLRPGVRGLLAVAVAAWAFLPSVVSAHDIYVMNDNHTDYNWNATAAEYDASMLSEVDYYLAQIAANAGAPEAEQARFSLDNWWYLWLYEKNRTPIQFQALIDAIGTGHISVPLNPFVTLYGSLPTEAIIRAGYYPGRIMRSRGVGFPMAQNIENATSPWGLASLWAGSGVRYTWKGTCACYQAAPPRVDDELFFWEGPDGSQLLFKWYEHLLPTGWGSYAEARDSLASPAQLDTAIDRTQARMPGISLTGLFGAGWDDVSWETTAILDAVRAYNAIGTGDTAVVSNGIDFFEALEASGDTALLNVLTGGWGNDWDMWPATLAERTARARRALERLRTAEALAAMAQFRTGDFWAPQRDALELGLVSAWKFFEHGWTVESGGPTLAQMEADKAGWAEDIEQAVEGTITAAANLLAGLFDTPDQDRVVVFNPLGFTRTDVAHVEVAGPGPYAVVDLETGARVACQMHTRGDVTSLRFLATDVPSLGYRVYRFVADPTGHLGPPAATVDAAAGSIASARYSVILGDRGQILSMVDELAIPSLELAGAGGLNDFGRGTVVGMQAENVGAVSATLKVDLVGPARTMRVTLFRGVDRVEVENEILENVTARETYGFHAGLAGSAIRFEENGAVARPGLRPEGGDFLPGTRAGRMALNHFVDFAASDYHLTISNWDAFAMQVNDSTDSAFDLTGDRVRVIALEPSYEVGVRDQGGDSYFLHRFALNGFDGPFRGAEAMRMALAHQNPLHSIPLPRNQAGGLSGFVDGMVSIDAEDVVVTAFKPAEDAGAGFILRAWGFGGRQTGFRIDAGAMGASQAWRTSLVETDEGPALLADGVITAFIGANQIRTWRFTGGLDVPITVTTHAPSAGARLRWTEGAPPFVVRRALTPGPNAVWVDLTPPTGTMRSTWTDRGVLDDGVDYYYRVVQPR